MKKIIARIAYEDLKVSPATVSKWRERGSVPHPQRLPVLLAAKKRRVRLNPEKDFEWETRQQKLRRGVVPTYAEPIVPRKDATPA